jgi:hypothetical protein
VEIEFGFTCGDDIYELEPAGLVVRWGCANDLVVGRRWEVCEFLISLLEATSSPKVAYVACQDPRLPLNN